MGLDEKRIVLVSSKCGNGFEVGTGYLVSNTLVLTANHVLGHQPESIKIFAAVAAENDTGAWYDIELRPAWVNHQPDVDTVVLKLKQPLNVEILMPDWAKTDLPENADWKSLGYPVAASVELAENIQFKTAELSGKLQKQGGKGQGTHEMHLGVDYETPNWGGISGAPVFIGDKLAGVIITSLKEFNGKRLAATLAKHLLEDKSFVDTINSSQVTDSEQNISVLILEPENTTLDLKKAVSAALKKKADEVKLITGKTLSTEPVVFSVATVLATKENLLGFVETMCSAPIMVFDVTDFEPAVMLLLGIRAVIRRGVTLTTTTKFPRQNKKQTEKATSRPNTDAYTKETLSELPFNILETKLIDLHKTTDINSPAHRTNWIGDNIIKGLLQLKNHSNYLDLPAYNAVRCPEPEDLSEKDTTRGKVLVLCSFTGDYIEKYWDHISNEVAERVSPKSLERMIDISSPKLVGLALYESIRWTKDCVIDWTQWRANVFFEMGVRVACSPYSPVCFIEENDIPDIKTVNPAVWLKQKQQLITLFEPTVYKLNGSIKPFDEAFRFYGQKNKNENTPGSPALEYKAIYNVIQQYYYWQQEPFSQSPDEELIATAVAVTGKDREKQGSPKKILFSANPAYNRELDNNVIERYIAAWYYLKNRYTEKELNLNPKETLPKFEQMLIIGEEVVLMLKNKPEYNRIWAEISKDKGKIEKKINKIKLVTNGRPAKINQAVENKGKK